MQLAEKQEEEHRQLQSVMHFMETKNAIQKAAENGDQITIHHLVIHQDMSFNNSRVKT